MVVSKDRHGWLAPANSRVFVLNEALLCLGWCCWINSFPTGGSDTSQGPERLRARLEVQITLEDGPKFYMKRELVCRFQAATWPLLWHDPAEILLSMSPQAPINHSPYL